MTDKITEFGTATELARLFADGNYAEVAAGLHALRPDLSDADLALEFALAAVKVLAGSYASLRKAIETLAGELDVPRGFPEDYSPSPVADRLRAILLETARATREAP